MSSGGKLHNRYWNGSTWSDLKTFAFTSDIPTKTSQLTNDSGYVTGGPYLPLSGGTLSGILSLNY